MFKDNYCFDAASKIADALEALRKHGDRWIWKDGKDGFDLFLKALNSLEHAKIIEQRTLYGLSVFLLKAMASVASNSEVATWK